MAGYHEYSMSNNALDAYNNGEKPLSKWTKTDILEAITNAINTKDLVLGCDIDQLLSLSANDLKQVSLKRSSWHHTSNFYNKTDFYSLDFSGLSKLTDKKIQSIVEINKEEKESPLSVEIWKCEFLEWSGSRKHPKATTCVEVGEVKGNWFYRQDGTKKKTDARGFRFLEQQKLDKQKPKCR